jgi:hypothetical protein
MVPSLKTGVICLLVEDAFRRLDSSNSFQIQFRHGKFRRVVKNVLHYCYLQHLNFSQ